MVECGFSMDDICIDVLDYHVEYERKIIETNSTDDFTLKVFPQRNVQWFQIGFGVPEVGSPINSAEASIDLHLVKPNIDYIIDEIKVIDKGNTIQFNDINASVSMVKCMVNSTDENCLELSINDVLFREQFYDEAFIISAMDAKRYNTNHYMNEGLQIQGPSLNPPLTYTLQENREKFELTRTDKVNDIWTDQFGYTWTRNNHDTWLQLTTPETVKIIDAATGVMKRSHSSFDGIMNAEREKATMIFDGTKLLNTLPDRFTYD